MTAGETCDDAGESDMCDVDCTAVECGDGVTNTTAGEQCDDGNMVDDDGCSNSCQLGSIRLGGSSFAEVQSALDTMGVNYVLDNQMWLPPDSGYILIMADDGGTQQPIPDYVPHLDNGNHVLMIGGSNWQPMRDFIDLHFATNHPPGWHTAGDCNDDWNTGNAHPITTNMPASYEFINQSVSYHMTHFADMGQPPMTTVLGNTCHDAPNNHVLATRKYPGGGTITWMALDLGQYSDANSENDFTIPFLDGYFTWIGNGAP